MIEDSQVWYPHDLFLIRIDAVSNAYLMAFEREFHKDQVAAPTLDLARPSIKAKQLSANRLILHPKQK